MSAQPRANASGTTLVLLCSDLAPALDLDSVRTRLGAVAAVQIVDGLCNTPSAVATALRTAGTDRAVVGLCNSQTHTAALLARARRAGARPFGVLAVSLAAAARMPSAPAATRTLAGAVARLEALLPDEPGRAVIGRAPVTRAGLLSLPGAIAIDPVASPDRDACIGSRRCGLCIGACPHDAIALDGDAVRVDTRRCTACGSCVSTCPTGAFHLAGAAPGQIEAELDAILPAAILAFRCRHATTTMDELPGAWATIELPSLNLVTVGWILQALAGGATAVRLLPCDGACCSEVAGRAALGRTVLSNLGDGDASWRVGTSGKATTPRLVPLDRGSSATVLTERTLLTEPHATADALARLGGLPNLTIVDPKSPLGEVSLDTTACTVCGACTTVCPTKALELAITADTFSLRYDPALCTGCTLCATVCPERALSVQRALNGAQLRAGAVELASATRSLCTRCSCELPNPGTARRVQELLATHWRDLARVDGNLCSECARRPAIR
jgi:ferredoxin